MDNITQMLIVSCYTVSSRTPEKSKPPTATVRLDWDSEVSGLDHIATTNQYMYILLKAEV